MTGNETPKDENRIVKGGDLPDATPPEKRSLDDTLKTRSQIKKLPVSGFDEYNNLLYQHIESDLKYIEGLYKKYTDDFRENSELIKPFAGVFFQATRIERRPEEYYTTTLETVDELHPDILTQLVDGKKENMSSHTRYALDQIQKYTTDDGNIQIKNNPLISRIIKAVNIHPQICIPKNPYLLLLPLTHQERLYILPIFNEAHKQKLYPFSDNEVLDNQDINKSYAPDNFPKKDHIFSLESLFKIGDALKLGNLAEYMGELKRLVGMYKNAEKE